MSNLKKDGPLAGFDSPDNIKAKLQKRLYESRKRNRSLRSGAGNSDVLTLPPPPSVGAFDSAYDDSYDKGDLN